MNIENSIAIDLAEDIDLQFTRTNMLFAFDNIELERTTEFTIPATAHNNAILGLANDAHTKGDKVRARAWVQLQAGGVTKSGYLYVTGYEDKKYKCIFVTGELLGLRAIKEAGKLADLIVSDKYVNYPVRNITPANASQDIWEVVNYKQEAGFLRPSASLNALLRDALAQVGAEINFPNREIYRIIPASLNVASARDNAVTTTIYGTTADYTTSEATAPVIQACGMSLEQTELVEAETLTHKYMERGVGYRYGKYTHLSARVDIDINFSDEVSKYYFLRKVNEAGTGWDYLGDYTYTGGRINFAEGTPLTGRTITIEANTPFMLFKVGVTDGEDESGRDYITAPVTIASASSFEDATQPCYLQDNLPDIDIIEGAKAIASLTGTLLTWDEDTKTIGYDASNLADWRKIDITNRLLSVGEMVRGFGDYAQNNYIKFDNAENVQTPLERDYKINNVNLEAESELLTIPFSGGDAHAYEAQGVEYVAYMEHNHKTDTDKAGIARAEVGRTGWVVMQRAELPRNPNIFNLCQQSTKINVKFTCPLVLYEAIGYKTLLHLRGADWAWNKIEWSNDIASAELAQVNTTTARPVSARLRVIDKYINADGTYKEVVRVDTTTLTGEDYEYSALHTYTGYDIEQETQEGVITGDTDVVFNYNTKTIVFTALQPKPDNITLDFPSWQESYLFWDLRNGGKLMRDEGFELYDASHVSAYRYLCGLAFLYSTKDTITQAVTNKWRCKNASAVGANSAQYTFVDNTAVFDVRMDVPTYTFAEKTPKMAFVLFNNDVAGGLFPTIDYIQ